MAGFHHSSRLVHETRMNRMRAKYKRNGKMFKYLRIHTYFIGICICFCYTFCLLINHNGFRKGGAHAFVEVAGGHPHCGSMRRQKVQQSHMQMPMKYVCIFEYLNILCILLYFGVILFILDPCTSLPNVH